VKKLCIPKEAARRALHAAQLRFPEYLVTLDEVECEDVFDGARQWREKAELRADKLRRTWPQERCEKGSNHHLGRLLLQMARVQTSQMLRRTVVKFVQTLDAAPPTVELRVRLAGTEPTEEDFVAKLEFFIRIVSLH
jgi:hypothetical protein